MFCKGFVLKCFVVNDLVYGVLIVILLVNKIFVDGKKLLVELIVYGVFCGVEVKNGQDVVVMFKKVFDNVCLIFEVCSCCVGGLIYQVLVEVKFYCVNIFVLCWFVSYVKGCCEKMMIECLQNEIFDVLNGLGVVVKCCEDMYKMVELNCVFVYYCW